MTTNIFPVRSQVAAGILSACPPEKVLIVPVDFAKKTHVVQLVRGTGEYLRKRPLNIHNTVIGAEFLVKKVEKYLHRLKISKNNVLFGGEDTPVYACNFISAIQQSGYAFVRVNACEAAKYRTNSRAVSDALALTGITHAILQKRAYDIEKRDRIFTAMKLAERNRRKLKRLETAVKNRIHSDVSVLFPEFLLEAKTGLVPFGPASLNFMESDFSVVRIRRMHRETLIKKLKRWRVQNPGKTADTIKELAAGALPPEPDIVVYREKTLAAKVRHLRCLRENIDIEENEMARCLVQTAGFLITSITGVGVVLGGGIVAEYGDPDKWLHADNMASYAGIVVRQHQTGGPDKKPVSGKLPLDANHHLKDQLLQAAYHAGRHSHRAWKKLGLPGEHRLKEHYHAIELRDGCSRLSTAKLILKTARAMIRDRQVYLPLNALNPDRPEAMPPGQYIQYLLIVAEMLSEKWKRYDLTGIPDEDNQLKTWIENIEELAEHMNAQTNR